MEPTLEDVLRGLEEATAFAKSYRFELTADYVALIERVEALPQNQPGAHKSDRWLGHRRSFSTTTRETLDHREP